MNFSPLSVFREFTRNGDAPQQKRYSEKKARPTMGAQRSKT